MTTESHKQSQIKRSKTLATARRRSANNRTDSIVNMSNNGNKKNRNGLTFHNVDSLLRTKTVPAIFGHQLHHRFDDLRKVVLSSTLRLRLVRDGSGKGESGSTDLENGMIEQKGTEKASEWETHGFVRAAALLKASRHIEIGVFRKYAQSVTVHLHISN